jgi:hypothetical protein
MRRTPSRWSARRPAGMRLAAPSTGAPLRVSLAAGTCT